jgi:hypothetical protein
MAKSDFWKIGSTRYADPVALWQNRQWQIVNRTGCDVAA